MLKYRYQFLEEKKMFPKYKRILCLALSLLLCLSLCACKKDAPSSESENENKTEENKKPNINAAEDYDPIPDEEILYDMNTWLGRSETGKLEQKGDYKITEIKSEKDLAPYKDYMYFLTQENIDSLFQNKGDKCLLVELTGRTEHTLYGTASIMKGTDTITIYVSVEEYADEIMPLHTYFLLHIPAKLYTEEKIELVFVETY